jgi:hypothetical protein
MPLTDDQNMIQARLTQLSTRSLRNGESATITLLVAAYKAALHELGLTGRSDSLTEIIAKKIIEFAKQGQRDPTQLRKRAAEAFRQAPPDAAIEV